MKITTHLFAKSTFLNLTPMPLRVGQEELVDSVIVDATIYNPGGPHLGAFPGPLLGAFRHLCSCVITMNVYYAPDLYKHISDITVSNVLF